jgi:citrate/tricarballylate utilization protein
VSLWKGVQIFLRNSGAKPGGLFQWRTNLQAIWDVLRLKYLDGGGHGCNYPDDRFSMVRRYLHHAVFYGFMLCLASTTVAAFYDHFLHRPAPYPIFSWPVVLGTVGGIALLIGTGGLLYLKGRMDKLPASEKSLPIDISFLILLFFVSLTGLLLLALRETPLMGILLTVHIGLVLGLFITMPYGKFVHGVYRYVALVQNAKEQSEATERKN